MASKQLLSGFGKKGDSSYTTTGVHQGLDQLQIDIEDTAHLSTYFHVVEFDPVFTAGKNSISFNGSDLLADGSEIKVEVLDSYGNSLYLSSPPESANFVDIANFTVAIYVYRETISGAGTVILVGTTTKGESVRWTGNITINTTYPNVSRVRFYYGPTMEATPLLYPVVESITGSSLSSIIQDLTGSFWGTANPAELTKPTVPGISYIWADQNGNPNYVLPFFDKQMEGQTIHLSYDGLRTITSNAPAGPYGFSPPDTYIREYQHFETDTKILSVISPTKAKISEINVAYGLKSSTAFFTMSYIKNDYINPGSSSVSGSYQQYTTTNGSSSIMQKSYVDILYRNTDTFSGFIARHKLYAKSNIYPGDFTLIQDSVIGPSELLIDPISVNKAYSNIGILENQDKINQYWFVSSASLQLSQSDSPMIAAMSILTNTSDYSAADGNSYVIAKNSAIGLINDSNYYPFDAEEYVQFNGNGYASNFIFLPQGVLHLLSANMIVDKDPLSTARIEFYLTSSSPNISGERDFSPTYGWKFGTVTVSDKVSRRIFPDVQQMFFTPLNDYYGTLVIVPYNCNVTLANISIQNYGDYGFSPGAIEIQLPFPINVANESFTLKAELFDSNANLVYTIPSIVQLFDPTGASLFGTTIIGSSGTSTGIPSTVNTFTVLNELYLPGIGSCPSGKRLLGYNIPTHHPPLSGEGSLCYTDVTDLELTASNSTSPSLDYLSLSTTSGTGKSIAVRYSGMTPNVYGRRVYVDPSGVKTTYL